MKCWDCPHFKIKYEPYKVGHTIWDLGQAKCEKHDLVVDFASHRYLKTLECVEKDQKSEMMENAH